MANVEGQTDDASFDLLLVFLVVLALYVKAPICLLV